MSKETNRVRTEVAHVLFMDIVGYSRMSMEEQARLAGELRTCVRDTPEFKQAESTNELIRLDTGDGMALLFFRDPLAPFQCAIEIAEAIANTPNLRLRMGIHSGPVSRVSDINGKENVTGSGINIAQRVMDCGDAGHILVSKSSADVLREFEIWASSLTELGECEVKHGTKLHLFSLHRDVAGNPDTPASIKLTGAPASTSKSADAPQVAILYKRNAEPDERLLRLLEAEMVLAGFKVFVDRHLAIGVEWATEIERQVKGSYAVVPLLSESSIQSEMLEYELETAHKASQTQNGRPRILPVRINLTGQLPERSALAAILNPLNYVLWQGSADDARLVVEIIHALKNPPRASVAEHRPRPVGGAVPLDSEFYIVRATDHEFTTAIARQDSIVLVKGARQMGKTSLLARGLHQARQAGAKVVMTDFQTLNNVHLASPDTLFLTLAQTMADQLDLNVMPEDVWNERRGANMNLERFIRKEVLGSFTEPLVWGMDEVDRLFSCDFGSEVFGLFRSWHNRRSLDPTGPWSRMTLAIAYATEAHLFISDLNQSPFNVGTRLTLGDFTVDQVSELNQRHGTPLRSAKDVARFYELVSGLPYLVQRGLNEMVAHNMSIDALEAQADRDEGLFGDHLRRILVSLSQDKELTEVVRGILRGKPCPTSESFYRLRSAGVMAGDSASEVRPRCRLYRTYLERHLL